MSQTKIIQERIGEADRSFSALHIEMKNAGITFLSEGEDRLGTLVVSIPQRHELIGPPISSVLIGDRNITVARALAERLAERTKKIALISVFIRSLQEKEAGPLLLELVEKVMKKKESQE